MHDPINEVLSHLCDEHIAEAALYKRRRSGLRKAAVCLLIAACCTALLGVGITAWQTYMNLSVENDGMRSYIYRLLEEVPANAPDEVRTVYLPDAAGLRMGLEIAFCTTEETPGGTAFGTVYQSDLLNRISITQFTFQAFQDYKHKVASEDSVLEESEIEVIDDMQVLFLLSDGEKIRAYWSDGMYCYILHASSPLQNFQWRYLITSMAPEENYAAIAETHPYYHPDSGTLDSILVPRSLPENGGILDWGIKPYWAGWSLYDNSGYGVSFDQIPLDQRTYYTENGYTWEYGGTIQGYFVVNGKLISIGEVGGFRDYIWYEEGDRCDLRFDKETGWDFDTLARELIEGMLRMEAREAEEHYLTLQ